MPDDENVLSLGNIRGRGLRLLRYGRIEHLLDAGYRPAVGQCPSGFNTCLRQVLARIVKHRANP